MARGDVFTAHNGVVDPTIVDFCCQYIAADTKCSLFEDDAFVVYPNEDILGLTFSATYECSISTD